MTAFTVTLQWVVEGKASQSAYDLRRPIIIGRQPDSDILIPDPKVSRTHASLFMKDGQLRIVNLSQTNKVHVIYGQQRQSLGYDEEAILDGNTRFQISATLFDIITYAELDPTDESRDQELKIVCPTCGRAIPARLRDCPFDGATLANGKTFVLNANNTEE